MKKLANFLFVFLVFCSLKPIDEKEKTVDYQQIIESESEWIRQQQILTHGLPVEGAIVMNSSNSAKNSSSGKYVLSIAPHFATLACINLLEYPVQTNIETAEKWIKWYISHINRTPDVEGLVGTIYDYRINANDYTDYWTTYKYSASDARGALLVSLLKKYYDVTGNAQFLLDRKDDIELLFDSAIATMRDDGLTDSRPQYKIKYLQDNVQVQTGLRDMVWLQENVFHDDFQREHYRQICIKNAEGIENMWLKDENEYIYYRSQTRAVKANWTKFYGDAVSMIFPVYYGIIEPESQRAIDLYNKFNQFHPERVNRISKNQFPWMQTAIVSALMNDKKRTDEQLFNMKQAYMDTGRPWPWHINESASAVKAAKIMQNKNNQ